MKKQAVIYRQTEIIVFCPFRQNYLAFTGAEGGRERWGAHISQKPLLLQTRLGIETCFPLLVLFFSSLAIYHSYNGIQSLGVMHSEAHIG